MPSYLKLGQQPEILEANTDMYLQSETSQQPDVHKQAQSQQYQLGLHQAAQKSKLEEEHEPIPDDEEIVQPIPSHPQSQNQQHYQRVNEPAPPPFVMDNKPNPHFNPGNGNTGASLQRPKLLKKDDQDYSWLVVVMAVAAVLFAFYMKK